MKHCNSIAILAILGAGSGCAAPASAQQSATSNTCLQKSWRDPPPSYKSVEIQADSRVTFRVCAPLAKDAKLVSADLPDIVPTGMTDGIAAGAVMTRDATGLWSWTTARPVPADTYRFAFQADGAPVPDPRGTAWSEQVNGVTSVFEVPGPEGAFQTYDEKVQHGTVSVVEYWSKSLGIKRRAHVYTPPGYMRGTTRYPVLYLVHGAGDSDDSWTSVGHAQYILDNLIAAGKAKPMIIVMPAGHTPYKAGQSILTNQDFGNDFLTDLIPTIDRSYRTIPTASSRAMAGLSMGGAHTINFGLPHSDLFRYLGIFSMGIGIENPQAEVAAYENANAAALRRGAKEFKLVYYAIGKDDFIFDSSKPMRRIMDHYAIPYVYKESSGGHTWINWRRYLNDFAPMIFK